MSRDDPSSAWGAAKVLGGTVLWIPVVFLRSALVFVAVPAGLMMWLVLLPAMPFPRPEMWRACRNPIFCVKFALLLRDALLGRIVARPTAGADTNPWPWPWDESPADIRRYGLFTELI